MTTMRKGRIETRDNGCTCGCSCSVCKSGHHNGRHTQACQDRVYAHVRLNNTAMAAQPPVLRVMDEACKSATDPADPRQTDMW
jgi:hypothetical protein